MTKGHPDPNAYQLRPVRAGDEYSKAVEGGFRRARAPEDGLVVEQEDRTLFLSRRALLEALGLATNGGR